MVNKVTLIGNLGRDPESKTLNSNMQVCNFSVATTSRRKNSNGEYANETTWHNVVAWGKVAEIAQKYLKKGSKVHCEGTIRNSEYTDKENIKRYKSEIHITELNFLDNKPTSEQSAQSNHSEPNTSNDGFNSDDLPF